MALGGSWARRELSWGEGKRLVALVAPGLEVSGGHVETRRVDLREGAPVLEGAARSQARQEGSLSGIASTENRIEN